MPDDRVKALDELFDRQRRYVKDPWSVYPIFLRPCSVKILMVTDQGATFGVGNFGLKALLDTLAVPPGPWVRFDVTKAHRRTDPSADLQQFRFDAHDLSGYDQIWLFGVERAGSEITETELRNIARFMDDGGGVFATGDHEDLGVALCGRVPRVRSMRKWYWPNPGPNGEPVAPKTDGPNRLDTLSPGNDPGVQFDDQSDDVPQCITPRLYSAWPWSPYFHRAHPHPLLCGPRGIIRVLPDHPHEGECYEPADLSATFTFDGYQTTEYPGGVAPEVIAWSTIHCGRTAADVKGVLNPRTFGAIGAFDGHRGAVGRVVVDATWHHFFDVNLVGELGNPDPVKQVGFAATTAGNAAYQDIQAYYRNIAVWLARTTTQRCMWWRALWWTRWHHRIAMDLRPPYLTGATSLDLGELIRIGGEARDVLGLVASRCTVRRWLLWEVLRPRFPHIWKELVAVLDPWHPRPPLPDPPPDRFGQPDPDLALGLHGEVLVDAVLGAAVYGVAAKFGEPGEEARSEAEETDFGAVIADHVEHAVRLAARHALREAEELRKFGGSLRAPE
jgi:hypothetical protein